MNNFVVKFYAPYTFANFACVAKSEDDGCKQLADFFARNCYMIMNREIKSAKFGKANVASPMKFVS